VIRGTGCDSPSSKLEDALREFGAVVALVFFVSTPAFAQGYIPLPNQLSLGTGFVRDRQPQRSASTFVLSFAFADSGEGTDYWPYRLGLVWEGELGARSDVEHCQARSVSSGDSPNCDDAAMLVGLRFDVVRRAAHRVLPFVNLLLGSYWKGSGVEDREFRSEHFTFQGGGGVDLRRRESAHGLRLSLDYRRVVATNANRNQLRFLTAYVLGPSGARASTPRPRAPGS
jgi:hypothetical protein